MFQNLIVAASAIIKNGEVVSTLEIGKNGMTTNWFTVNSQNCSLYLNDSVQPHICLSICSYLSVRLPVYSNVLAGRGTWCLICPWSLKPSCATFVPCLSCFITTSQEQEQLLKICKVTFSTYFFGKDEKTWPIIIHRCGEMDILPPCWQKCYFFYY